jgi:hypothetical protein
VKNLLLILLISILFIGCNSETQEKAIDEILNTYGGTIVSSKGVATGTNQESQKYFEVEIENPEFFKEDADRPAIAGGCALILYNNFSEAEKEAYGRFDIIFKDKNSEEQYRFPLDSIKMYYQMEKIALSYVSNLLNGEYEIIANNFIEGYNLNADSIKNGYKQIIEEQGAVIKMTTYIVKEGKFKDYNDQPIHGIKFQGLLIREARNYRYTVIINPYLKFKNIIALTFSYK